MSRGFSRDRILPKNLRIALMGGAYGNVPALRACLEDARAQRCTQRGFLGDAIGCCGHSDEIIDLIRGEFDILVAGNHELQAAAGQNVCGCGYSSMQDEKASCEAFNYAAESLSDANRQWLATWPDRGQLDTPVGTVLLCHGSPRQTNEFLYPSSLDENLLQRLLVSTQTSGFVCTHSGFPWLRKIADVGFAANCGVVGKPDHDGDPAVHYLIMDTTGNSVKLELRRVTYDYESWANQLRREGVSEIFIQPLITGTWTVGIESLPPAERKLNRRPDAGGTILEWEKSSRPRASADTKSFGHGAPVGGT